MPDLVPGRVRRLVSEPMEAVALRARVTRPYWRRRFGYLGTGAIIGSVAGVDGRPGGGVRLDRGCEVTRWAG